MRVEACNYYILADPRKGKKVQHFCHIKIKKTTRMYEVKGKIYIFIYHIVIYIYIYIYIYSYIYIYLFSCIYTFIPYIYTYTSIRTYIYIHVEAYYHYKRRIQWRGTKRAQHFCHLKIERFV